MGRRDREFTPSEKVALSIQGLWDSIHGNPADEQTAEPLVHPVDDDGNARVLPGYQADEYGTGQLPGQENNGPHEGEDYVNPMSDAEGPEIIYDKGHKGRNGQDKFVPNAGGVPNMGVYLDSPGFGSDLKRASRKTKEIARGRAVVYEATKDIGLIKKGDRFYLDKDHDGNHLEVFTHIGKSRNVLNIDGTENEKKTERAVHRRL